VHLVDLTQQPRYEVQYETHSIVLGEKHLRQTVRRFLSYYHASRCHLALEKDAPEGRAVQPPEQGHVIEIPEVGGLHHRYERRAA